MNYLMRIANPYIYMCRIANPTQRPALRTSPRTGKSAFFCWGDFDPTLTRGKPDRSPGEIAGLWVYFNKS